MNRRSKLIALVSVLIVAGMVFAAMPFVNSLGPTKALEESARVKIAISDIPHDGAIEVDLGWYKALVTRTPELEVFVIPFRNGAYGLPDPHWDRAIVPCSNLVVNESGISCEDPTLPAHWNREATWNREGKNMGDWMPDLQTQEFRVQDGFLILDP